MSQGLTFDDKNCYYKKVIPERDYKSKWLDGWKTLPLHFELNMKVNSHTQDTLGRANVGKHIEFMLRFGDPDRAPFMEFYAASLEYK